jgi:hypothetical protein
MADIELVIKIPEELYEAYKGRPPMLGDAGMDMIAQAIANGTPLPKGHGRLIDANAFILKLEDASKKQKYKELIIDDILTVDDVFKAIIESLQNEGLAEGDSPTVLEASEVHG